MKQFQKAGTVWQDEFGRKYEDTIVKPHLSKQENGELFLQAAFYFDADALENNKPPFKLYSIKFSKDPVIKEFVAQVDNEGNVVTDNEGNPVMDFEKTTFVHVGAPRICQNLHFNWPIDNPLSFTPKNRASQLAWNELEFIPGSGLKFGDYYDFEGGLLPE